MVPLRTTVQISFLLENPCSLSLINYLISLALGGSLSNSSNLMEACSRLITHNCNDAPHANLSLKPLCICFGVAKMFNNIEINSSLRTTVLNSLVSPYMPDLNGTSRHGTVKQAATTDLCSFEFRYELSGRTTTIWSCLEKLSLIIIIT